MLFLGMAAAANFAWVNRSSMTFLARQSFAKMFKMDPDDLDMHVIYDVSHNIAKFEEHTGINFGESGRQRGSSFLTFCNKVYSTYSKNYNSDKHCSEWAP